MGKIYPSEGIDPLTLNKAIYFQELCESLKLCFVNFVYFQAIYKDFFNLHTLLLDRFSNLGGKSMYTSSYKFSCKIAFFLH